MTWNNTLVASLSPLMMANPSLNRPRSPWIRYSPYRARLSGYSPPRADGGKGRREKRRCSVAILIHRHRARWLPRHGRGSRGGSLDPDQPCTAIGRGPALSGLVGQSLARTSPLISRQKAAGYGSQEPEAISAVFVLAGCFETPASCFQLLARTKSPLRGALTD